MAVRKLPFLAITIPENATTSSAILTIFKYFFFVRILRTFSPLRHLMSFASPRKNADFAPKNATKPLGIEGPLSQTEVVSSQ
jgi:hypothetical protein